MRAAGWEADDTGDEAGDRTNVHRIVQPENSVLGVRSYRVTFRRWVAPDAPPAEPSDHVTPEIRKATRKARKAKA